MEIQKKNLNYVFRVEVSGLGEKLERDIIIDCNDNLASLAYMVLASINALSHHMFSMTVKYISWLNLENVAYISCKQSL